MKILQDFKTTSLAWELRRVKKAIAGRSEAEVAERNFYSNIVPGGSGVIVDVGANCGSKVEIFRSLADTVIAFEPDATAAQQLRRRFAWCRNVVVRECAISSRTGPLTFYRFAPGSAFNTADLEWVRSLEDGSNHMALRLAAPNPVVVEAMALSEAISGHHNVKYLKVDVEGHELEVISTLDRKIPLISLEFNISSSLNQLKACISKIESLGEYEFNAVIAEPPRAFEFHWCKGVELISMIASRRWPYVEVYAKRR